MIREYAIIRNQKGNKGKSNVKKRPVEKPITEFEVANDDLNNEFTIL